MATEALTLSEITNIAGVAALHAALSERLAAADGAALVVDAALYARLMRQACSACLWPEGWPKKPAVDWSCGRSVKISSATWTTLVCVLIF